MRKKTTYMITVFLLSIVILCCVFPIIKVNAFDTQPEKTIIYPDDWFNYDWLYRWKIDITWGTGENLFDYQIRITIPYSFNYSQIKENGVDIRFTNYRNHIIPHWIENWNTEGTSRIWVTVPTIIGNPEFTDYIYMYFGNSEAVSTSSGEATFLFFDDFETKPVGERPTDWIVLNDFDGDIIISG